VSGNVTIDMCGKANTVYSSFQATYGLSNSLSASHLANMLLNTVFKAKVEASLLAAAESAIGVAFGSLPPGSVELLSVTRVSRRRRLAREEAGPAVPERRKRALARGEMSRMQGELAEKLKSKKVSRSHEAHAKTKAVDESAERRQLSGDQYTFETEYAISTPNTNVFGALMDAIDPNGADSAVGFEVGLATELQTNIAMVAGWAGVAASTVTSLGAAANPFDMEKAVVTNDLVMTHS
jgi:hypothetical protein